MYYFLIYFEGKTKLSVTEKKLSAEIAKYDDTNELKEEQRNDLYLVVQR
jgi:cell division protein FtsB